MLAAASSSPNFILPNATILVELVLFIVVLGLTSKFVLKPVQRVVAEREATIREGQQASDAAGQEAAELDRQRAEVLEQARNQAREILEEATRSAAELRAASQEQAQAEHNRLFAEANTAIEAQRSAVRGQLIERAVAMVGEAASRVLGAPVDVDRHRSLIEATVGAAEERRS